MRAMFYLTLSVVVIVDSIVVVKVVVVAIVRTVVYNWTFGSKVSSSFTYIANVRHRNFSKELIMEAKIKCPLVNYNIHLIREVRIFLLQLRDFPRYGGESLFKATMVARFQHRKQCPKP